MPIADDPEPHPRPESIPRVRDASPDTRRARPRPACLRAAIALAAFLAGITAARYLPLEPAAAWFAGACMLLALAGLARGWACAGALTLACVLVGGGMFTVRVHERSGATLHATIAGEPDPGWRPDPAGRLATLEGVVGERPRARAGVRGELASHAWTEREVTFPLIVRRCAGRDRFVPVRGRVRVAVAGESLDGVGPGDRVRVRGVFRPVAPRMNPGEPARALWAAQRAEVGWLDVPDAALIRPIAGDSPLGARIDGAWRAARGAARDRAERILGDDGPGAALLRALILGQRDPQLDPTREAFVRLGIAHLMAISGFHLSVMVGAALGALRLTGDRGRLEPLLLAGLLLVYLVIVPSRAPVVRAGVMVLALLAGEAAGRRHDRLAVLAWIAAGIALARPMDVFSLGYQLSMGLTGVLLAVVPRVRARIEPPAIRGLIPARRAARRVGGLARLVRRWVLGAGLVTLICWSVSLPAIALHTGRVSLLSVPATLVVMPAVVVLLWGGYAAMTIGVLVPPLGEIAGRVTGVLGGHVVDLVLWLDGWRGSWLALPPVSLAWAALATIAMVGWWAWGGTRRRRWAWGACALASVVWLAGEAALRPGLDARTRLRIDTLAVGDGACHLIRSGGEAMLYDCGSRWMGLGERTVPDAVRALGARRVPTIVLSHPNLDHFSGVPEVIEPLGVERVVVGPALLTRAEHRPEGAEAALLAHLRARGVSVEPIGAGDTLGRFGRAHVRVLSAGDAGEFEHINDTSLVLAFDVETSAGPRRLLMTGDIEREAMAALGDADLAADVLELPHHGSFTPHAAATVERVDPRVVLQSTGPSRLGEVRWRPLRRGRAWHVTARDGASWAAIRADGAVRSGALRPE